MNWIDEIKNHAFKKHSQNGEEGYAEFIFSNIGNANKFFVEIGCGDSYHLSNTRYFKDEHNWNGVWLEAEKQNNPEIHQEFINKENAIQIFSKYNVPAEFDFLSIDIDSNDYWVLNALLIAYKPRLIVAEFNASLIDIPLTIKYDPNFRWQGDNYFGMSLAAGRKIGLQHGYTLVHQNDNMNLWLVRNDLIEGLAIPDVKYERTYPFPVNQTKRWVRL